MSLEDSIIKLTAAVEENNALLRISAKTPATETPATSDDTPVKKPSTTARTETAAAKKKRLAKETKEAKEAADKLEAEAGISDVDSFKSAMLAKVEGRSDAMPFLKEFLSSKGWVKASEVPEDEWDITLVELNEYIVDKANGGNSDDDL